MLVSRLDQALSLLDDWVKRLTDLLPSPVRETVSGGDFYWRFPEESLRVLLLCKAVRLSTALGGAWELAKKGYSTEAGTLLRAVGDFASEINFMGEAALEGGMTKPQQEFLSQFFRPLHRNMDEFLRREREYYV